MVPIAGELGAYAEAIVGAAPGIAGRRLRSWYYGRRLAALGGRAGIGPGLLVRGPERIRIGSDFSCWRGCTLAACDDGIITLGDRVSLNSNVYINACMGGSVVLGNDVLVGPNVVMRASDHRFADLTLPINRQGHTAGEIVVGDDVWIAAHVTLVAGARVGQGAVIAAGAVVTGEVAPFMIVGGIPAREIGRRE